MTTSAGDWKQKKAEHEMYLEMYEDGFVVDKDGILRDRDLPENIKILEQFMKGSVPNQFNKSGAVDIDCHVIWHGYKYADRKDKEKTHMGIGGSMKEFEKMDVQTERLSKTEWFCTMCTLGPNVGTKLLCPVCNTKRPRVGQDVKLDEEHFNCRTCSGRNLKGSKCCGICGVQKFDKEKKKE